MGASDWTTGLAFSALASLIGASSKLCLRRSYTCLAEASASNSAGKLNEEELMTAANTDEESNCSSCGGPKYPDEDDSLLESPRQKIVMLDAVGLEKKRKAFALRGLGMFGMIFLSPACTIHALQFASPSILCPLGSGLMLVLVVILSEFTIGEKPRPAQIMAASLIVLGEVLVSVAGDHTNVDLPQLSDIWRQYEDPAFISYLCGMLVWVSILVAVIRYGTVDWRRFSWGLIGGSVTGVQCFIKDSVTILHRVEWGTAYPTELYFLLFFAGLLPLIGLLLLMQCMKRYEALYSTSMFVGSMVVSASIMAAIHYHTFDHLNESTVMLYPLGLLILLSGVSILAIESRLNNEECDRSNHHERMKPLSGSGGYGAVELANPID